MPDCCATQITIGGKLKRSLVAGLAEAIEAEGFGDNYESMPLNEIEAVISEAASKGECITVGNNDQPWGNCDDLKAFCQEHGLAYCHTFDAHYEWSPGVFFWEPGMAAPREWIGNQDGYPLIGAAEIRKALKAGTLPAVLDLMERADAFPFKLELTGEDPWQKAAESTGWQVDGDGTVYNYFSADGTPADTIGFPSAEAAWRACCEANGIEPATV